MSLGRLFSLEAPTFLQGIFYETSRSDNQAI